MQIISIAHIPPRKIRPKTLPGTERRVAPSSFYSPGCHTFLSRLERQRFPVGRDDHRVFHEDHDRVCKRRNTAAPPALSRYLSVHAARSRRFPTLQLVNCPSSFLEGQQQAGNGQSLCIYENRDWKNLFFWLDFLDESRWTCAVWFSSCIRI